MNLSHLFCNMKFLKHFFSIVFLLTPVLVFSQEEGNSDYEAYKKKQDEEKASMRDYSFAERSYWGGSLSLSLGNLGTYAEVSPIYGYNLSKTWSVGVGATFKYYSGINPYYGVQFNTMVWGGGVFSRYLLGKHFFLQGELEYLNTDAYDDFKREFVRKFISVGAAGIGFRSDMGYNSYSYFLVMYDFIGDRDSPYPISPIIFKAGMIFPIKSIE